ncbi:Cordon-bleu protein-like 1 [Tupaia chinensis]|uniref:Cordon-bleu protein-like 1 n=1 Tax=Tupaia chinensis TaxID=246437 RepID=L9J960_TUPCH|nr:Cordon-bleu protein-like 1 [Tupaia chinensis]
MPASQRVPQDPVNIQERPASCVVKSMSVDETEKVETNPSLKLSADQALLVMPREIRAENKEKTVPIFRILSVTK